MKSVDVLVVGGGPAGLATAIALRMKGAMVAVADARKPPIDKACGEGLLPGSLADLRRLGVDLTAADGGEFRGIRFVNHSWRGEVATACFPNGMALGVSRQVLHARLTARAEEVGVDLRWESAVQFKGDAVRVKGEQTACAQIVGADGHSSRVRAWAGLERGVESSRRYGFRQHFAMEPWSPYVEVHWGRSGQVYVTPVGPGTIGVAAVVRDPHCRLELLLQEMPRLREQLTGAPIDSERGAVTTTKRLRRVAAGRVALVGDASGSVDAITGEGLGMAFRQGMLLSDCLAEGDMNRYQRLHSETLKMPQQMARVLMLMDRFPVVRDRAITMLAGQPDLFRRLLGVHVGAEPLGRFLISEGMGMAWNFAFPERSPQDSSAPCSGWSRDLPS